eukprot:TRINITY_DN8423_c0_g1_i3.p1 TRINITY_DN8423_c0_g1~~TRINITY_DN8423_c0_g1_i3.p1  ORF type:complete len:464 (+),score=86.74 TRINITY_DN8423_c0_g1_i3:51-1442(+)
MRVCILLMACFMNAILAQLAPVPPKGLNTWDSFRYWVTEDNVRVNGEEMVALGLTRLGWKYLVMDEAWYRWTNNSNADVCGVALDQYGRYLPDANRFPSSQADGGLAKLCADLAKDNITCGVHLISGISACAALRKLPIFNTTYTAADLALTNESRGVPPLNYGVNTTHPAAQVYFDGLVGLLSSWGIGFIKYDFASSKEEVLMMRSAVDKTFNNIVLSINGAGSEAANMFRISSDVWDVWEDVVEQVSLIASHAHAAKPNSWPDADMLPMGRIGGPVAWGVTYTTCNVTARNCDKSKDPAYRFPECCPRQSRLTFTQQRSLLSLWSLVKSPLIFGGYLPETELEIVQLLQNPEISTMSETGEGPMLSYQHGNQAAFTTIVNTTASTTGYFGLFNLDASAVTVSLNSTAWDRARSAVNISSITQWCLRDIWSGQAITLADPFEFRVASYDCIVGSVSSGACTT